MSWKTYKYEIRVQKYEISSRFQSEIRENNKNTC